MVSLAKKALSRILGTETVNYDGGGMPLMRCRVIKRCDTQLRIEHPAIGQMWVDRKWCY